MRKHYINVKIKKLLQDTVYRDTLSVWTGLINGYETKGVVRIIDTVSGDESNLFLPFFVIKSYVCVRSNVFFPI